MITEINPPEDEEEAAVEEAVEATEPEAVEEAAEGE